MPNLYEDTAAPGAPTPPLVGDVQADVAIVGGGFTGLSTALHLAEAGIQVTLLEGEEPGWGASGRNGGQVNPGLKHDPDTVERDFGPDLGRRMNALAGAAPALVFDLIERHGIDCDARRNGTVRAAIGERHGRGLEATLGQWARRGAPVELLQGDALERRVGTRRYRQALLDRRGGDLNPLSYARGLVRAALRAGAAIHGASRVLEVAAQGGAWRVVTRSGTVRAGQVVIATNGYSDGVWPGLRRSVVPLFGAIAATAPLPRALADAVMPLRSVLYESGAITVYYRVDAAQRLLIGGRGPQHEVGSPAELPHLRRYAEQLWPGLRGVTWTHAWGGRLAMTRDHYPHVHEPARGMLIALGYNGRGVALASAVGAQLAQRILHPERPFDLPITPVKAIALHALWPLAVRAAIVRGRVGDFLGL